MMWEVLSFGDKPYGEMSNQEVSPSAPHPPSPSRPPVALSSTYPHLSSLPTVFLHFYLLIREV